MTVNEMETSSKIIYNSFLIFQKLLMCFNNLEKKRRKMLINSIPYFFNLGVHHFLWDDSRLVERNGFRCPFFVFPAHF